MFGHRRPLAVSRQHTLRKEEKAEYIWQNSFPCSSHREICQYNGKTIGTFCKERGSWGVFLPKIQKKGTLFVTIGRERIFAPSGQWATYTVMAPLVPNASPGTTVLSSCSSGLTPETKEPQLRSWLTLFTEYLDKQLAWSIGYSKISWPKHPAKLVQGLPLQAPVWTKGAEGAHEWIRRFSCASDQGSHCFPPTIWHASPHFSDNLLFLHTIAFSPPPPPPPRSPYGYKWDQGGEHYTLSNGLPCIWKAKPRGLYNRANMQTNWNYNGTLEYIPEVFKPQRRKKSPPLNYKGLTETHRNWETQ